MYAPLICCLFVASWLPVFAAGAAAQQSLTLERALSLARENNRDLRAARTRVLAAEARLERSRAALWPTVQVQGKYTRNIPEVAFDVPTFDAMGNPVPGPAAVITPANQLDAALTGTIPLVVPSAYPAIAAADKRRRATESEVRVTETRLLYTTARVFYTAASADELIEARTHAIEVAQRTLEVAQVRLEAGTATRVEVTRANLALLRATQAAREARVARDDAYGQLATLTRAPKGVVVVPAAPTRAPTLTRASTPTPMAPSTEAPASAVDGLVTRALTQRPELAAQQLRLSALSAEADALRYRWAPTLSAFGSARAFNYAGFSGRETAFAVGVQLDWLAYDGGARDAERHDVQAQIQELLLERDQLHHAIGDEVREAARAVEVSEVAVQTAEVALSLSSEALALVRAQYEAGAAPQMDLLAAQDDLVAAEVAVAQARFKLALSQLSLARSAGDFPPDA